MKRHISVNLGNLLLSFSDAMDLASPQLARHQQRTAFIAWELGRQFGLSEKRLERLFTAALLHDIGALSAEEKISLLNFETEDTNTHCVRGEILLKKVPWLESAAEIIRFHHREWQDWNTTIDTPLVLESQLISIADYLERLIIRDKYILHQDQELIAQINSFSGTLFSPQIIDIFMLLVKREEFWLDLISPRLYSVLLHNGPYRKFEANLAEISAIAELFKSIIDFRSRFTATHSSGVAACAELISQIFGFTEIEVQLMQVAGNLHDIGKLSIPNSILEKPGKLTKEEFAVMRSHTYYTYSILNTIGGLQQIAEWAAYHHERLDGSGYPFHCAADELTIGSRIMAVADIFTAMAEDRPYRKGMSKKEIVEIMTKLSNHNLLDSKIVRLLFDNYDKIFCYVREKQSAAYEFYGQQFAFLNK